MAKPEPDTPTTAEWRSARSILTALVVTLLLLLAAIALMGGRDFWVAINLLAQSHAGEGGRSRH